MNSQRGDKYKLLLVTDEEGFEADVVESYGNYFN